MKYFITGNDERYEHLRTLLNAYGCVEHSPAELLILGPRDSITDHKTHLLKNGLVLGGLDSDEILHKLSFSRLKTSEEFRRQNSRATAEGALMLAILETKKVLYGTDILVLGFGFLGKEIASCFQNFGCHVTIASRSELELSLAGKQGYRIRSLSSLTSLPYFILLNTIPHRILSTDLLSTAPDDSILIELASTPCCRCAAKSIRTINAGGLPGRYTPYSAAEYLFEEIRKHLNN